MAFKENLKIELDFQGKKVKELAAETGISRRTIDQYLSSAAKMPSAINAVKIAAALSVSVEELVVGENYGRSEKEKNKSEERQRLRLYKKYKNLIEKCERLSPNQVDFLAQVAERLEK